MPALTGVESHCGSAGMNELVRQSEILFGEPMTRRLQERAADTGDAPAAIADAPTAPGTPGAAPEFTPQVAQVFPGCLTVEDAVAAQPAPSSLG